jgi:hypothetical protein
MEHRSVPNGLVASTPFAPITSNGPLNGSRIKFETQNEEVPRHDLIVEPQKKKQKRNKPTLSCEECVERKTKVS